MAPPSLVGDIGGGAMYLAVGLLAGVMNARASGKGQVVDAAIVDGSAHMMSLLHGLQASGRMQPARGQSLLDGPHWYNTYRCADGGYISVGALEPKFYRELRERLGLAGDPAYDKAYDPAAGPPCASAWPHCSRRATGTPGARCWRGPTSASRQC